MGIEKLKYSNQINDMAYNRFFIGILNLVGYGGE